MSGDLGPTDAVISEVRHERQRQISAEGWTPAHDDQHTKGQMAIAAALYAVSGDSSHRIQVPVLWPWAAIWWKPTTKRRDLVKAAALIVAEIERLDRQTTKNAAGSE